MALFGNAVMHGVIVLNADSYMLLFLVSAQVSTSILPYLKLWPVDTYVDLMMQVMCHYLFLLIPTAVQSNQ